MKENITPQEHPHPPEPEVAQLRRAPQKKASIGNFLIVLFLLLFVVGTLIYANEFRLDLVLTGEQEYLLEYGDRYQEPGANVILSGKWVLSGGMALNQIPVQSTTDLVEDTLGKYTVEYSADIYGFSLAARRTVRVVDRVAPIITLLDRGATVLPGHRYEEEGFIAVDNHDGNLTDKVRSVEKHGVVTYTVMDASGNPTSVMRKVKYLDPKAPELELKGDEYMTVTCGTIYTEPGYSAKDNVDGEMTEEVAVEGEVIWYVPGTYEVVYTVADDFGNVTQKVRTVEVQAVPRPEVIYPRQRTIYLTFDDGPGPYTMELLDLLARYGVKATFFVTNSGSSGELWRMHREGHSIGIHTMTHDYDSIYASEEAFFTDLQGMQAIIYRETGVKTTLMRFPGGGSNLVSSFNKGIMTTLTQAVQDAGFQYFDWNVDSNDAGGALKRQTVADNVIAGVQNQRHSIVLQHDIHSFSVDAVEDIILWGLEHGYQFLPLTPNSPTMQHDVLN